MKLKITASLSFSNSIESVFFDSVIGKESQTAPLLMHASNCRNRTWTSTSVADVQKAVNLVKQYVLVFRQTVLILGQKGIFRLIVNIDARLKLPQSNLNKH